MSAASDTAADTVADTAGDASGEAAGSSSSSSTTPRVARRYPPTPLVGVAVAVFRHVGTPDIPAASGKTDDLLLQNRTRPALPRLSGELAIAVPQGEVLLVQRKHPPRAGEWGLPGGRLRLGEHLAAGVQRELWEECAILARLGGIFDAFEPIVYDTEGRIEYHYVVIEYWADYHSGIARADDDAAALAWIPMDTLENYSLQADSQQLIRRAYRAWQDWTANGKNE